MRQPMTAKTFPLENNNNINNKTKNNEAYSLNIPNNGSCLVEVKHSCPPILVNVSV